MKRILITGAGGFTGRYVAAALASKDYDVYGLGSHADSAIDGLVGYHRVDLANVSSLRSLVEQVRPDGVIHLAGIAFVGHGSIAEIYETNLLGTRNLLQALADSSVQQSSIILASSANVYGNSREGVLDENVPFNPANDYAASKASMEMVAKLYSDRLPITITRPFNYTGRGQSDKFLVPKIVDHFKRRAPVLELGNIDVSRDFSDVRVIAEAYARLLTSSKAIGTTVNLCSGRCYSLREILSKTHCLSGHTLDVKVNPDFVRSNEVRKMLGDPSLLHNLIGPLDMPPLEETLSWMLEA